MNVAELNALGCHYQNIYNKAVKENLGFNDEVSRIVKLSERPLIIFPQATRVLPNERPTFKKGAARIYEELQIDCQPIAINSGYVWPKKGVKKPNKNNRLKFDG